VNELTAWIDFQAIGDPSKPVLKRQAGKNWDERPEPCRGRGGGGAKKKQDQRMILPELLSAMTAAPHLKSRFPLRRLTPISSLNLGLSRFFGGDFQGGRIIRNGARFVTKILREKLPNASTKRVASVLPHSIVDRLQPSRDHDTHGSPFACVARRVEPELAVSREIKITAPGQFRFSRRSAVAAA
jgi:hypothetical protein